MIEVVRDLDDLPLYGNTARQSGNGCPPLRPCRGLARRADRTTDGEGLALGTLIETLQFISGNLGFIGAATVEHISLVAVGLAVITGVPIGIAQTDSRQLITGALAVSLLAIVADYALLWLQRRLAPAGLRA